MSASVRVRITLFGRIMYPAPFYYYRPSGLQEALQLLSRHKADAALLAGGQTLMPKMNLRQIKPAHLIDLNAIGDLAKLAVVDGTLEIGAMVRHQSFCPGGMIEDLLLPPGLKAVLGRIANAIGNLPVRLRGTLGGSLADASPKAQWSLLAHLMDTEIVVDSTDDSRRVGYRKFLTSSGHARLRSQEAITKICISLPPAVSRYGFVQLAPRPGRPASAFALARIATNSGRISEARIAIGACTPAPVRLCLLEDWLRSSTVGIVDCDEVAPIIRQAFRQTCAECDPFLEHLAVVAVSRAITQAMEI